MPLIKSISGIRGTIGGRQGENLTPADIIRFTTAYVRFLKQISDSKADNRSDKFNGSNQIDKPDGSNEQDGQNGLKTNKKLKIVVGRDGRISGEMIKKLVIGILLSQGVDVVDIGLATTPSVEMAVPRQAAQGGIIITASHNPAGWNGLKLLSSTGEFLSAADGQEVLQLAEENAPDAVAENEIGYYVFSPYCSEDHLREIIEQPLVNAAAIIAKDFKIVVDGINSVGGHAVPNLLQMLGVKSKNIFELNCIPDGKFAHNPEPLADNLSQIMAEVKKQKADLGIVVDPDVDRLVFIDENGEMFGEEYTLVAIANYVLENFSILDNKFPGRYEKAAVSNLSSSRALRDIALKHSGTYAVAAVGEVNVVAKMKESKAVIGGEGNGGVIYPPLHYGRDALIGIALFLTSLATRNKKVSELKKELPEYFMAKERLELGAESNVKELLAKVKDEYEKIKAEGATELGKGIEISDLDGIKIDWPDSWVQLRASNTEPIIRIYAEAKTLAEAQKKTKEAKEIILAYIK
ncbi:MAG: phosphoglucosamine mutase [Patescibacteria group bacterium]